MSKVNVSCVQEIKTIYGNWWVGIDTASIDGELVFNNYGEVQNNDSVYGGFATEQEATDWLNEFESRNDRQDK